MTPMIQSLEGRRMLSAAVENGVLTVTGTAKRDDIHVSLSNDGKTLTVSERTLKRFKKSPVTKTTFDASAVTSIVVNAGAGSDRVALMGNKKADFLFASTINGEDGNDRLGGGNGADVIHGGAGDDDLFGHGGTDLLNGGEGDDLLVGGKGVDTMNGDGGDDLLKSEGDGAIDILDGGADSAATGEDDADEAEKDETDVSSNLSVLEEDEEYTTPPAGEGHKPKDGEQGPPPAQDGQQQGPPKGGQQQGPPPQGGGGQRQGPPPQGGGGGQGGGGQGGPGMPAPSRR